MKKLKIIDAEQDDDYLKIINDKFSNLDLDVILASIISPTIIHILNGSVIVPISLSIINAYRFGTGNLTKKKYVEIVLINCIILVMQFSKLGLPSDPSFRIALFILVVGIITAGNMRGVAYLIPTLASI